MRLMFFAGLFAFLADQVSKYVVIHMMGISPNNSADVLPPVLNLRYGENRGVNFGLFGSDSETTRWTLIIVALIICIAVTVWVVRNAQPRIVRIAAGFLIGGALGNVFDRVYYSYVLDFLNTSCCGWNNPTVYNVADVFIFAGALGLVFFAKDNRPTKKGA
jgi:signal peptidase II|tara:strand:+ start:115 stop:597 length:483 start_codon:yes stop_codon:yes gene_type:complete